MSPNKSLKLKQGLQKKKYEDDFEIKNPFFIGFKRITKQFTFKFSHFPISSE